MSCGVTRLCQPRKGSGPLLAKDFGPVGDCRSHQPVSEGAGGGTLKIKGHRIGLEEIVADHAREVKAFWQISLGVSAIGVTRAQRKRSRSACRSQSDACR
jgi:hypothetical protein